MIEEELLLNMTQLRKWELAGILFTAIAGTLLHFVYGWSGQNLVVSLFAPVNESTWEHLKLLFFPAMLFSIVEGICISKAYPNFIAAKFSGILIGLACIVIIFYTYSGIIGRNFLIADILTFYIGVVLSSSAAKKIYFAKQAHHQAIAWAGFALISLAFFIYTYRAPHIKVFQDPLSGSYGLSSHINATKSTTV